MKDVRISLVFFILLIFAVISVEGQSTNVEFPTPVTSDMISGRIKARDIGDPRSTVYYYAFQAQQGDVFLKIEANNFNGDVDVFYADNLRPVTKITLYADSVPTQTSRELYFRKPEKLILRVEGRTPNDDPATFQIKFEGSFLAMAATKSPQPVKAPEIKTETDSDSEIKVNSVGTIIEVKPKPTPTPKETVARNTRRESAKTTTTPEAVSTIKSSKNVKSNPKVESGMEKKTEVRGSEETEKSEVAKDEEPVKEETKKTVEKPKTTNKKTTSTTKGNTTAKKTTTTKKETSTETPKPTKAEELAKALENVNLIVEFKDGRKIERPMNDVIRFGVDKGFLTIVHKDGSIGRYSILEISKISVE
jgi:hypothetical protein